MDCKNPEYCEECGDCIICYAEDPCPYTEDGKHIRSFESVINDGMEDMLKEIAEKFVEIIVKYIVKCNNCKWIGFESELLEKACPKCKRAAIEYIKLKKEG